MKKSNCLMIVILGFFAVNCYAGGGVTNPGNSSSKNSNGADECFSNDGSKRPCNTNGKIEKIKASPAACLSSLPFTTQNTCLKNSVLARPFMGEVTNLIELIPAKWIQNPLSNTTCKLAGRTGYFVHYDVREADQVFSQSIAISPTQSKYFEGMTAENRMAFNTYSFSGLATALVRGSELVIVSSGGENTDRYLAEGTTLTKNGKSVILNGAARGDILNLEGQFKDMIFNCK